MQTARAANAGLPASQHEQRGPLACRGQEGFRDVAKAIGAVGGRISAMAVSSVPSPGKQNGGNRTGSGTLVELF